MMTINLISGRDPSVRRLARKMRNEQGWEESGWPHWRVDSSQYFPTDNVNCVVARAMGYTGGDPTAIREWVFRVPEDQISLRLIAFQHPTSIHARNSAVRQAADYMVERVNLRHANRAVCRVCQQREQKTRQFLHPRSLGASR